MLRLDSRFFELSEKYDESVLTFGSNFNDEAVRTAALPSFKTTAKPATNGEYSISVIYLFCSKIGTAIKNRIFL